MNLSTSPSFISAWANLIQSIMELDNMTFSRSMVPKGGQVFNNVYPALVTIQDASKESSVAKAYLLSRPLDSSQCSAELPHKVSLVMCRAKLAPLTAGHTAPRGELTCLS